jgi:hypothetical protein
MECRECGTRIADKAIVCFRCGTSTAAPGTGPEARPAGRSSAWPALAVALVVAAAGLWADLTWIDGLPARVGAGIGVAGVAGGLFLWLRSR